MTAKEYKRLRKRFYDERGKRFKWTREEKAFWKAFDAGISVIALSLPRGFGKTTTGGVAAACVMIAGGEVYCGSGDKKQADRIRIFIERFVQRNPELRGFLTIRVDKIICPQSHGSLTVEEKNLSTLGSGSGSIEGTTFIIDEAAVSESNVLASYATSLQKNARNRLIMLSTAGDESAWWTEFVERCKAGELPPDRVAFIHVEGDDIKVPPFIDKANLETADMLVPKVEGDRYLRNIAGQKGQKLFTPEQLDRVFNGGYLFQCDKPGGHYVGIDLGVKSDRAAVGVVGAHGHRARLELLKRWTPAPGVPVDLAEVERFLLDLPHRFSDIQFWFDPWQSVRIMQALSDAGLNVHEYPFTEGSVVKLSRIFYNVVAEDRITFAEDPEFRKELKALIVKRRGFSWRMDHASKGKSDMAVAVGLAVLDVGLIDGPKKDFSFDSEDDKLIYERRESVIPQSSGRDDISDEGLPGRYRNRIKNNFGHF